MKIGLDRSEYPAYITTFLHTSYVSKQTDAWIHGVESSFKDCKAVA